MFKIGDQVRFSPEFIAVVHKKERNREEARKRIYNVVDVRKWEPHLIFLVDEEELSAEIKAFREFLADVIEPKTKQTLIPIGNLGLQSEQKICIEDIEDSEAKQAWLRASHFELA
jgi:hypothetical protein